jgi:holo-[acyl-carrier protein] synthase
MKPLRPFPLPIRVGTDICQISRIFGIVASGRGTRFVDRVLTKREQERESERLKWIEGRAKGVLGTETKASDGLIHQVLAKKDPELWSLAAFLAGR